MYYEKPKMELRMSNVSDVIRTSYDVDNSGPGVDENFGDLPVE